MATLVSAAAPVVATVRVSNPGPPVSGTPSFPSASGSGGFGVGFAAPASFIAALLSSGGNSSALFSGLLPGGNPPSIAGPLANAASAVRTFAPPTVTPGAGVALVARDVSLSQDRTQDGGGRNAVEDPSASDDPSSEDPDGASASAATLPGYHEWSSHFVA